MAVWSDASLDGFTLLELVVVLSIMALLLISARSLLADRQSGFSASAAARILLEDLRSSRGLAVVAGRETTVLFDVSQRCYTLPSGEVRMLPRSSFVRFRGPEKEVSSNYGSIRFFPDGSSSGGEVDILVGGQERRISVSWLTGRVLGSE